MSGRDDAVRRLTWGARRWWPLVTGVVVLAVGLSVGAAAGVAGGDRYEATSLVTARQLAIRPFELPRYAHAVFSDGSVAEAVSDATDGRVAVEDVVGEHVVLEPVLDSVALRVVGRADDPAVAMVLADAAAAAFVDDLNRPGDGVGTFAVQRSATLPAGPVGRGAVLPAAGVGLVSGLAVGLGAVGVLLVARRPVIDGVGASDAAGAPLLAVITDDGSNLAGVDALARHLVPMPRTVAVLGAGGDARRRRVLCAGLVGAAPGASVLELPSPSYDAPQLVDEHVDTVLVVQEGEPAGPVRRLAARLGDGDLLGVVFMGRPSGAAREVGRHERVAVAGD